MSDLISRSALIKHLTDPLGYCKYCKDCPEIDCMDCIVDNVIKEAPAVDAAEVVHGWWIDGEDDYGSYVTCSICKDEFTNWDADCAITNFCPNCGAKMDGERKDDVQV